MSFVSSSPALLREAENFTLFIKNSISFPRFKVNRFVGKEGKMQVASKGCSCWSQLPLSPSTPADFTPEAGPLGRAAFSF